MGVNSGMLNEESRTTIQYLVPPIGGGGGGGGEEEEYSAKCYTGRLRPVV